MSILDGATPQERGPSVGANAAEPRQQKDTPPELVAEWRAVTTWQTVMFRGREYPVGGECLPGQRVLVVGVPQESHTTAPQQPTDARQQDSAASACPHCSPSAAGHSGRTPPRSGIEFPVVLESVSEHPSVRLLQLLNEMQAIVVNEFVADQMQPGDLFGAPL